MNAKQLHIIQHSLGRDGFGELPRGSREEYRNRYVIGPECDNFKECQSLVATGLMVDHGAQAIAGGMHCFSVTEAGRLAMFEQSPEAPKLSRSKKRYQDFLHSDCGLSFREWLGINPKRTI